MMLEKLAIIALLLAVAIIWLLIMLAPHAYQIFSQEHFQHVHDSMSLFFLTQGR